MEESNGHTNVATNAAGDERDEASGGNQKQDTKDRSNVEGHKKQRIERSLHQRNDSQIAGSESGGNYAERRKGDRKGHSSAKSSRGERRSRKHENRSETSSDSDSSNSEKRVRKTRNGGERSSKDKRKGSKQKKPRSESESDSDSDERGRKRRSSRKRERSPRGRRKRREDDTDSETEGSGEEMIRRKRRKKEKGKKKKEKHKRIKDSQSKEEPDGAEEQGREDSRETNGTERTHVNRQQEAARQAAEELKRSVRQNAEAARARLAGDLQQARAQQMAMQNQFGAVDPRAMKKINAEKRKLKSMVKASRALEELEAKEAARMDAFRVAMGLPTAEAQRQAEWRAEATQQAALLQAMAAQEAATSAPRRTLGPSLPSSRHKPAQ